MTEEGKQTDENKWRRRQKDSVNKLVIPHPNLSATMVRNRIITILKLV